MKKGFMNAAKKAQIALAVMAAVGCSFVGAKDVLAADTVDTLAARVKALETALNSTGVAIGHKATTSNGVAIGGGLFSDKDPNGAAANGEYSIAIGGADSYRFRGATANGAFSVAMVKNSVANGQSSFALGESSTSNGDYSYAIGCGAKTNGASNYAVGNGAKNNTTWVVGQNCNIIVDKQGYNIVGDSNTKKTWTEGTDYATSTTDLDTNVTTYYDANGVKVGDSNTLKTWTEDDYDYKVTDENTNVTTYYTTATSMATQNTVAIGRNANATGGNSYAIGTNATVAGGGSYAIGVSASSTGSGSYAIGNSSSATAQDAFAFGNSSKATNRFTTAIGTYANAQEEYGTAVGFKAHAAVDHSVAIGDSSVATEARTVSFGSKAGDIDGHGSTMGVRTSRLVNVTDGRDNVDAATVHQIITAVNYDSGSGKLSFMTGTEKTERFSVTITPQVIDGSSKYNVVNTSVMNTVNGLDGKITTNTSSITDLTKRITALENGTGGGVDATGKVVSGETNAVSGGNLYTELRPTDGNYVKKDNTTAGNLKALDTQVKANADAIGKDSDITSRNVISDDASVKANLSKLDAAMGNVNSLADAKNGIKDVNGKVIGTDGKTTLADAVNAVNGKVGDLTEDGSNIAKDNTVNENLANIDSAIGDIKGLKISDKNGNEKTGMSVAEAVETVNGKADQNAANIAANTQSINRLDNKVNKVGAGAAALAALHPLDFDPDDKLTFAAGYGNYQGENAVALGAFYRPDEKVMFSVAGNMGNGENMINAGVSFALDRTHKTTTSKAVMARKIEEQAAELAEAKAEIAELKAMVQALAAKK